MKRIGLIFLLFIGLMQSSCSDKNKLPADVLPQAKMQAVLWDLMRAGNFLNNYVFYKDVTADKTALSQQWNERIFEIHKISRGQFSTSYKYYQEHPQMMKAIMDSIGKIKVEQTPAKQISEESVKADTALKRNAVVKSDSAGISRKLERFRKSKIPKTAL